MWEGEAFADGTMRMRKGGTPPKWAHGMDAWSPAIECVPGLASPDDTANVVPFDDDVRAELRRLLAAGELSRLVVAATVFRAEYPNANFYRFRDGDLPALAASFVGVPFLRNHEIWDVGARAGKVLDSRLNDRMEIEQLLEITVPRDIEAVLNGQIDRFSISWFWREIRCSVCGQDYFSAGCPHVGGRRYARGTDGTEDGVLCELIFEGPRGREVSAVNSPAVSGTALRGVKAALGEKMDEGRMTMDAYEGLEHEDAEVPEGREARRREGDDGEAAELLAAQRSAVLEARLGGSGLPAELRELVRESLRPGWRLTDLDRAVAASQAAWARLEERRTVQGMHPKVGAVTDGTDRLSEALSALVEGRRPKDGIPPLSGIREAYLLLSGDYEMTGMFFPERVGLANVTSTTMANIVANVLNKVVVSEFQQYPRWWESICRRENFNTLQTIRWIILGGVGSLPTVAEGAAYTELSWDDKYESAAWVKKGGYLGLTLEAMDMDDVGRLRSAPRALAQAAWLTLGKSVSSIFTTASGLGPTLTDTGTLFNATAVATPGGHANLGTAALSITSWQAAKLAMRKQVEVNSGERLGALTTPRYLLVPPDLENTALTVLASENMPGTANNDINPEAEGNTHEARLDAARRRVIVVDLWTDTNDWAAAADPRFYPTIGIGFRFGQTPEIFSVASPNSGLMFTNDVMPIKVRWFYAVGAMDWRGLYKANVT